MTIRSIALIACLAVSGLQTAIAGHYRITFSTGPKAVITGSNGTPWNLPYVISNGNNTGNMGGGGIAMNIGPGGGQPTHGSVKCDETMTATFTWQPTNAQDLPPPSIVIRHIARASWSGEAGDCDNVYEDPVVSNPSGGVREGTHYQVKPDPGTSFTLTLKPTSEGSSPSGSFAQASAGVKWTIDVYLIKHTVAIAPRAKALAWDNTNKVQNADYTCTSSVTNLPTGWNRITTDWTLDSGTNFVIDSPSNPVTQAHARGPGEFKLKAVAGLLSPDGQNVPLPAYDYCAAFGGPIQFSVVPGAGAPTTWTNDSNDPELPYYLQHFYVHGASLTATMQRQQTGKVKLTNQPPGTTMTWTLPAFLYTSDNKIVTGTESTVNVTADDVGTGAVTCALSLHWLDPTASKPGAPVYVDVTGADDTATSQYKLNNVWTDYVNEFHAHKPASLTWTAGAPYVPSGVLPGGCGAGRDYTMRLFDSESAGMPDVWVNERFTPDPPSWFKTNFTTGKFWVSTKPNGVLNAVDTIFRIWDPNTVWQSDTFYHDYWAASKSAVSGSSEGFLVGGATITLIPQNGSTPASAGQS